MGGGGAGLGGERDTFTEERVFLVPSTDPHITGPAAVINYKFKMSENTNEIYCPTLYC